MVYINGGIISINTKSMHFFKKNILKVEVILITILSLFLVLFLSSYTKFFLGFKTNQFDFMIGVLMSLFAQIYFGHKLYLLIILLFGFLGLTTFPVMGFFSYRTKKYIVMHILLLFLIILHFLNLSYLFFAVAQSSV